MEERTDIPETTPEQQTKTPWQMQKEGWYDKVPLTVKQLDIIITVCFILLGLTVVAIALEAMGIWSLFS